MRLLLSKPLTKSLVEDQEIDFPRTLASFSDNNITAICDIIGRCGGLVSQRMLEMEGQISVLTKQFGVLHSMMSAQCCTHPYQNGSGQMIMNWGMGVCHISGTVILFINTVSRSKSKSAPVFATDSGWSHWFLIKLKSEAYEMLSLIFQWDGVKPAKIYDNNTNEMIQGSLIESLKRHLDT